MSFAVSTMAFLRPLGPPKPSTIRHFLRFSQSSKPQAGAIDRNLLASQTASPSYPPPSLKSLPRPKTSHASHRTSQPTKIRNYPDRRARSLTPVEPPVALSEAESAPNLPYFVTRTPSNELPIYHLRRRGGNLRQTRVKKIDGDIFELRKALEQELRVSKEDCVVNSLTRHVVVKGWHKAKIEAFLIARKF